jgi:UDP-galactopyranose mutase
VVSTSIQDVIQPYQGLGLVHIADSVAEFIAACEAALSAPPGERLARADEFLSQLSWDKTWQEMSQLVQSTIERKSRTAEGHGLLRETGREQRVDNFAAGE